jgi:hypothetical protein
MKHICATVLAVTALAAICAPPAKAQQAMMTCVGMEGLYPAPQCGRNMLPVCSWGAMRTCKLSRKRWQPERYGSRCTAWHCTYIGPW